ncbi:NRDE family protein [Bacillus tuaregi]|uniref:NRDE family protein n=1 Tax=Bacillus tuaregi TaxID=1816695 RepID=UPI0008F832D9|nr:NRDE family protein [Bacillus tuaregi]
MCLILFAYHVHPTYKLIVAANRDEFYQRPTEPAHLWEDKPFILAGRDLEKMGTWMGVTKKGRFSALTNYRDPREFSLNLRSRGELVADALQSQDHLHTYMKQLMTKKEQYPGFNLLAGDLHQLYYYSNKNDRIHTLKPGIYGVSNHLLDTEWPKVQKGKTGLSAIIAKQEGDMVEELFTLLQDSDHAPDHLLPNTGVPLDIERMLSAMYIKSDDYGTRSSTVIRMTEAEISFHERMFNSEGTKNQEYTIQIEQD